MVTNVAYDFKGNLRAHERKLLPTYKNAVDWLSRPTPGLPDVFRDRPVVGIHALDLVWGLGTLHCLSQQEPRA